MNIEIQSGVEVEVVYETIVDDKITTSCGDCYFHDKGRGCVTAKCIDVTRPDGCNVYFKLISPQ